jgi:hypothetical protein
VQLIGNTLASFLTAIQGGTSSTENDKFVESASRLSKANELAQLLEEVRTEHLARQRHPKRPHKQ